MSKTLVFLALKKKECCAFGVVSPDDLLKPSVSSNYLPSPLRQGSVNGIQGLLPLQVLATRRNHRSVVDDLSEKTIFMQPPEGGLTAQDTPSNTQEKNIEKTL